VRRPRPTQGCRAYDDDDGGGDDDDDDDDDDYEDDDDRLYFCCITNVDVVKYKYLPIFYFIRNSRPGYF